MHFPRLDSINFDVYKDKLALTKNLTKEGISSNQFYLLINSFLGGCSQMETKAPLIPMEDFMRNPEKIFIPKFLQMATMLHL